MLRLLTRRSLQIAWILLTQTVVFTAEIGFCYLAKTFKQRNALFKKTFLSIKSASAEIAKNAADPSLQYKNKKYEILNTRLITAFSLLGPTFIKLAQVLSTRADILPEAVISALALLQDHALPENADTIKKIVEQELGTDIEKVFLSFDDDPLASASIGQVHSARLKSGEAIIVKVIKPNVKKQVNIDLAILKYASKFRILHIGILKRLEIKGFVNEFSATLLNEINYLNEADNCKKFLPILGEMGIMVPKVYDGYLTSQLIILERFNGTPLDKLKTLNLSLDQSYRIAATFTESYLHMVFLHGFYHADPHPGNVLVLENKELAFVDFGMVGMVSENMLQNLIQIAIAIARFDMKASASALAALGVSSEDLPESFIDELERLTKSYMMTELRNIKLGPLFLDVFKVGHKYKLCFPSELFLLVKTIVMCEGVAAVVYPSFSLPGVLVQFVSKYFPAEK